MTIVTVEKLENADKDADSLEKFISGSDTENVKTRKAKEYPTLANAVRQVIETGGFEPFSTEVELLASTPILEKKAAKALDTKKVWLWDGSKWNDTGLGELDLAVQYTSKLIQGSKKPTAWDVSDAAGKEAIAVTQEGHFKIGETFTIQESTQFAHVLVRDSTGSVALAIDKHGNPVLGSSTIKSTGDIFAYSIVDSCGRIALAIDKNGNQISFNIEKVEKTRWHKADVMMCSSLGQSLAKGRDSGPVQNTKQAYLNIMFKSGENRNGASFDGSGFLPLVAEQIGVYSDTPSVWHLNKLVEKQVNKGDSAERWVFLGSAPQIAGTPISGLNKGSIGYQHYIDQVQAAFNLCQSQGKTFAVSHNTWTQGEDDCTLNTSKDAYKFEQIKLKNDIALDVMRITGQKFSPILITYQCPAHRNYGGNKNYNAVAQAQFEAAIEDDGVYLACPIYHLQFYTDNVHLTSNGSQMLGYYYARVSEQVLVQNQDWMPLQPMNINWQGRIIDIIFNVPDGELVFDTELVHLAVNFGFDIWDKYDVNRMYDIISSVEIADKNRIRILLSTNPPESAILSYARGRSTDGDVISSENRPRGNLRDTAGVSDNYIDTSGNTAYLHNWCVMFNIDRNFSI